jgi:hypothetical protein
VQPKGLVGANLVQPPEYILYYFTLANCRHLVLHVLAMSVLIDPILRSITRIVPRVARGSGGSKQRGLGKRLCAP